MVAYDFSSAADDGVKYAAGMAKALDTEVILLHIVPESTKIGTKEWDKVASKLQEACKNLVVQSGIKASWRIKEGNIFDGIGESGKEAQSIFVLMPTHGKKGMQHLTGSYAGKVIMRSPVHILVTQKETEVVPPQKIFLPLDFSQKVGKMLDVGKYFYKQFNSELHILVPASAKDDPNEKVDLSFQEVKDILNNEAIPYKISKAGMGGSWIGQITNTLERKAPDLIIVDTPGEHGAAFPRFCQSLITNAMRIPVLCLR